MNACGVGAGAIGTFIGAQLARNGCEVSAPARGATAAALRAHGFRFQQDGGVLTAPVRVAEDAVKLGPPELVVLAVKGPSLPDVAGKVGPSLGPDTMVLTAMTASRSRSWRRSPPSASGSAVRSVRAVKSGTR